MDFETFIKRLEPKLKAISHKVNIRYTFCDEDDFLQEARLFLWQGYSRGEVQDKTDSYVLQSVYYFLRNYIRKSCKSVDQASVSMNYEIDDKGTELGETMSAGTTGIDDSVEIFMLLDRTEEKFNDSEKKVFYNKIEGYTTREIGSKLGVSHVMVVKIEKSIRVKCGFIREEIFF